MSPRRCLALALFLATTGTAAADHVVIPGPQPAPPPVPAPVPVIATDPPPPPLPTPPPRTIAIDPVTAPPLVRPTPIEHPPIARPPMMWLHEPISRLDHGSLPELGHLELALPLDRYSSSWADREKLAMHGAVGIGYGRIGERSGTASQLVAALGWRDRRFIVGARSEVTAFDDAIARGHHTLLLHGDNFGEDKDGASGGLDIVATADHGEGRGLAPVRLGVGARDNADLAAQGYVSVSNSSDTVWALGVRGEIGATRWRSSSASANRRAVGLSYGATPADGELPRGTFDLIRGRLEDTSIVASPVAALGGPVGPATSVSIRTSEVSVGLHDFTLHVDRELMGVIDMNLGWAWMQADDARAAATDLFRMKLATHLKWWGENKEGPRRIGIAIAREPGFTADGSRLVGDWRAQLGTGFENARGRFDARGGISWLTPLAGGDTMTTDTVVRYGAQLDAALKLGGGLELAAYHSSWFEPRSFDPWSSGRTWSLETGVLLRLATP